MKNVSVAIVCLALSLALAAPLSAQKKNRPTAAPPRAAVASPLDPTLADLERVSAATQSDLADLKAEKRQAGGKFGWLSSLMFWRRNSSHSRKTTETAESIQRNLRDALPGLVQDARASSSFRATFKLYNDLSVLCELLDSLVDSTKVESGKADGALANDASAMGRIRQDLATFVEQRAAALDANGTPPYPWPSASAAYNGKVKRIVVDDNVPQKPAGKKTVAARQP